MTWQPEGGTIHELSRFTTFTIHTIHDLTPSHRVQWAALGLGIAWIISLFKVVRAVVVAGGLAALGAYLMNRPR